jgi:GNAT superfamily N-acetyltransferase
MSIAPAVRRATVEDVPSIREILAAHDEDEPVSNADIIGPYLRHLIAHHRAMVSVDDGAIVGYGAVVDAGTSTHLADLFVRSDRLGQGIGRPLLGVLFGDSTHRTTFSSRDPRALPVYVRAGMAPRWVSLYLEGDGSSLPALDGRLTITATEPARMADVERRWTGADRHLDHAFWASQADADAFLIADHQGPLAVGYGRASQGSSMRALGRLSVRPDADPVPAVIAAIRRTGRGGHVMATVPGPNPALPVLLEHGFRILDQDQAMASHPDLLDPIHLLPNPAML